MEEVIIPALAKKEIGKNIKTARESSGLSLEEVAVKMRKTPGYVGLVEVGRRSFSVVQMITLADILGVTLNELLPNNGTENWSLITKVIASMRHMTGTEILQISDLCENLLKEKQINI